MVLKQTTTWAMVLARVLLCPVIILGAARGWDGKGLGAIVLFALLDDVYDGILARKWGCDTPALRLADSCADTIFYIGVLAALWIREPQVLRRNEALLAALIAIEALRYIIDLLKFRKPASYHSYLAKGWGLTMATAVIGVLSFGALASLLRVSILLGIAANLEGLAMSLLLPRWQNDVKTLRQAWRLRAGGV